MKKEEEKKAPNHMLGSKRSYVQSDCMKGDDQNTYEEHKHDRNFQHQDDDIIQSQDEDDDEDHETSRRVNGEVQALVEQI